jgi:hypothetical protein
LNITLFAPLYKITKVTNFTDDIYVIKFKMALEELGRELEKKIK